MILETIEKTRFHENETSINTKKEKSYENDNSGSSSMDKKQNKTKHTSEGRLVH